MATIITLRQALSRQLSASLSRVYTVRLDSVVSPAGNTGYVVSFSGIAPPAVTYDINGAKYYNRVVAGGYRWRESESFLDTTYVVEDTSQSLDTIELNSASRPTLSYGFVIMFETDTGKLVIKVVAQLPAPLVVIATWELRPTL